MRCFASLLILFMAFSAQAGNLSQNLSRETMDKAKVNTGSIEIDVYSSSQFNLGQRISEIKASNAEGHCQYNVTVSRNEAIKKIRAFNDTEIADILEKMYKRNQLKTAIVNAGLVEDASQDPACGQAQIEIYANDGEVLKIDYQVL